MKTFHCRTAALAATFALVLAGCAGTPPARPTVYDFGPDERAVASASSDMPPVVFGDVEAPTALDGTALLYRLGYHDPQQPRAYALARWSMPPSMLLRQRLRAQLGKQRIVLSLADGGAAQALLLRVELEEFSQLFDAPDHSQALVRLRAVLSRTGLRGHAIAQVTLVAQRPCPTPDANGGAIALAQASDAVVQQLDSWLASAALAQAQ